MENSLETYLSAALKRLERRLGELAARGSARGPKESAQETQSMKVLAELIKEQMHDENSRSSTRKAG